MSNSFNDIPSNGSTNDQAANLELSNRTISPSNSSIANNSSLSSDGVRPSDLRRNVPASQPVAVVRGVGFIARPSAPRQPAPISISPTARPPPSLFPLPQPRPVANIISIESNGPSSHTTTTQPDTRRKINDGNTFIENVNISADVSSNASAAPTKHPIDRPFIPSRRELRPGFAIASEDSDEDQPPIRKHGRRLRHPDAKETRSTFRQDRHDRQVIPPPKDETRPEAPPIRPPGIPDEQPPPPVELPKETKAVAPVRPTPSEEFRQIEGNVLAAKPQPPSEEPPTKKGKRIFQTEEIIIKRRDRHLPEFESSSDEEDKKDFDGRAVKQIKPPTQDLDKLEQMTTQHLKNYNDLIATTPKGESSIHLFTQTISSRDGDNSSDPLKSLKIDTKSSLAVDESKIASNRTVLSPISNRNQPQIPLVSPIKTNLKVSEPPPAKMFVDPSEKMTKTDIKYDISDDSSDEESYHFEEVDCKVTDVNEDYRLAALLPRGKLSITCIEAIAMPYRRINHEDNKSKIYVKFRLGAEISSLTGSKNQWKQTNAVAIDPSNDREVVVNEDVSFDIVDARQYVSLNDLSLTIQVVQEITRYDKTMNRMKSMDQTIASVTMSVVRFFRQPYVRFEERVPMRSKKDNRTSKVRLEFLFEEARQGMFVFTLYDAFDLRMSNPLTQRNIQLEISLGKSHSKKSKTVFNVRDSAPFNEEEIILWIDETNWANDVKVAIYEDTLAADDESIAYTMFSLLPYMNNRPEQAAKAVYDLYYSESNQSHEVHETMKGELSMKITFLPAGKLVVFVGKALGLQYPVEYQRDPNFNTNRFDPYVEIRIDGKAIELMKRTPIDKDGGADPVWNYELGFDIVDQYTVSILVYHQPAIGDDILLGIAEYSLFTVFRNGHVSSWIPLKQNKSNTSGVMEAGNIFIDLKFSGLTGIAYPQYQENVAVYDDTVRTIVPNNQLLNQKLLLGDGEEEEDVPAVALDSSKESEKKQIDEMASPIVNAIFNEEKVKPEFTDEEIKQAFNFIDLNHNGYIGAAEIRHILICMGEFITDEEIDMMISMIDIDGDGQISYLEFRTLVLHPNPDQVDLHKEIQKEMDKEILHDKLSLGGKIMGTDLKSFQRQKELSLRELKKVALLNFIEENDITFIDIQKAYDMYLILPLQEGSRVPGNQRVSFPTFCQLMHIEPIYEYKKLHALFDKEELLTIDFREFLLSCMNFIPIENELRVRFSFKMFDSKLTGYISRQEICEILRGNHMISLASVEKKADIIMKHISSALSNDIVTLNEFMIISKKFPNVLFPSLGGVLDKRSTKESADKG